MPMCQDGAVMSTRLVLDGAWYRACEGAWRSARRARIELVAAHLMREAIRCAISMQSDELGASELVGAHLMSEAIRCAISMQSAELGVSELVGAHLMREAIRAHDRPSKRPSERPSGRPSGSEMVSSLGDGELPGRW